MKYGGSVFPTTRKFVWASALDKDFFESESLSDWMMSGKAYTLECEDESVVQLREFFHTRGDSLGLESANDCVNSEFEDDWSAWKKNRRLL